MEVSLKEKAITLRKQGKTYSEILQEVPVAKSTLSLWFKSVHLASPQKQRITQKRIEAGLRGALARKAARLKQVTEFLAEGISDVGLVSERELWLIGIALYWAEGSKQNLRSPSTGIIFGNSDYRMIKIFLRWLTYMGIKDSDISFELYVHTTRKGESDVFKKWWSKKIDIPVTRITKVYLKKGNPKTNRINTEDLYHGLLRLKVKFSTALNRQIHGWVQGIVQQ